jgi:hypothetical protein
MSLIKLSDAIENLRAELRHAQEKGKDQNLQFDLQSIELELEVIAEGESGVSGKINWYIFGGGVDSKIKDATKHKLKLTLKAVDENGQPIRVSSSHSDRPD